MNAKKILLEAYAFLRLHRLVVLITGLIILGSIFSILILSGGGEINATLLSPPRKASRSPWPEGLPPRTLDPWGTDPFRDVLKEMEIARLAREKAEKEKALREALEAAEKDLSEVIENAKESTLSGQYEEALAALKDIVEKHKDMRIPLLDKARALQAQLKKDWDKAKKESESARKLAEKEAKEREYRMNIILSLRVDGIISGAKESESSAIVEGKPYSVGDTVQKKGVKALIGSIDPNGVYFIDPETGERHRVPLSR